MSTEQTEFPWGGGKVSCEEEGPGQEVRGRQEEKEAGQLSGPCLMCMAKACLALAKYLGCI